MSEITEREPPKVFKMPRTEEGREALRDHLFIVKNCGIAPTGHAIWEVDWDEIGEIVATAPKIDWSWPS
jgi:hypothetical protein